jgi:hypothetical protein
MFISSLLRLQKYDDVTVVFCAPVEGDRKLIVLGLECLYKLIPWNKTKFSLNSAQDERKSCRRLDCFPYYCFKNELGYLLNC